MALRWTTYLKSRLNCSIPGDYPFYFNHLRKSLPGDYCSDCQCFHRICEFDRWGHLPGQTYQADLWSLHNAGERHWRQRHLRFSGSQIPTWLDLNLEREKKLKFYWLLPTPKLSCVSSIITTNFVFIFITIIIILPASLHLHHHHHHQHDNPAQMEDILATFDGAFKEQETANSNWLPVRDMKVSTMMTMIDESMFILIPLMITRIWKGTEPASGPMFPRVHLSAGVKPPIHTGSHHYYDYATKIWKRESIPMVMIVTNWCKPGPFHHGRSSARFFRRATTLHPSQYWVSLAHDHLQQHHHNHHHATFVTIL